MTFRMLNLCRRASLLAATLLLAGPLAAQSVPAAAPAPALAPAPSTPGTAPVDSIVAVVEEDVILKSELDLAVANIRAQYKDRSDLPSDDVLRRQVLDRLILLKLQVARAESVGVRISDAELDAAIGQIAQRNGVELETMREQLEGDGFSWQGFREQIREELQVQRLRQGLTQSRVNVSDTEIELLLAQTSMSADEVRVGNLLIALPDGAAPDAIAKAREKMDEVVQKIRSGELTFDAAAIRYSDAPNALEGGVLDWRGYDALPAPFADVLRKLAIGEIAEPMRSPSGYHLLKLLDRREPGPQIVQEYKARGILIEVDEVTNFDAARAELEDLRRQIAAGGDFAELAREHSDDTSSRAQGGEMGWFQRNGYGSAVGDQLAALKPGQMSEPFQSDVGWHLIELIDTRSSDVTEESEKARAREVLSRRKAEEVYERFLRDLRSEAYVDIRLAAN